MTYFNPMKQLKLVIFNFAQRALRLRLAVKAANPSAFGHKVLTAARSTVRSLGHKPIVTVKLIEQSVTNALELPENGLLQNRQPFVI